MTSMIETFVECVSGEKKEGFSNPTVRATENLLVLILTTLFYVAILFLIAIFGRVLWNSALVPAFDSVKKVTTL